MTGYLTRAETARTLKAVIQSRPPHAHMSGDTGLTRTSETPMVCAAVDPDQAETANDSLV